MTDMAAKDRLIIALDMASAEDASRLVHELAGHVGMFKVGGELFTLCGPRVVKEILDNGTGVFLDLKFHDIPTTVERASVQAARMGVSMFDVHALGGREMMQAARKGRDAVAGGRKPPLVVAVTVLTHLEPEVVKSQLGIGWPIGEAVVRLAGQAQSAGLDGVVCSGMEAEKVRRECGGGFVIVCPGVRPEWVNAADEQKRRVTPAEAVQAGADFIVVGRPVTHAASPVEAAARLVEEMEGV